MDDPGVYLLILGNSGLNSKSAVSALCLVLSWRVQEHIRTKKRGRICNLNWAEFLNRTKNRTSSQE